MARKWTEEEREAVVEEVLAEMCEGRLLADTVKAIGARGGVKVSPGTVRSWIIKEEGWYGRYVEARVALGQALAEEAITIARDTSNQTSAADRVLIDTLKWAAARSNPVEWGDKQQVEHGGGQVLEVKVVEEEQKPVRNQKALGAGTTMLAVSAGAMDGLDLSYPQDRIRTGSLS